MSAATQNEMERLRKERDEWKQQSEGESIACDAYRNERDDLKQQLTAALEREQALAAQLGRYSMCAGHAEQRRASRRPSTMADL